MKKLLSTILVVAVSTALVSCATSAIVPIGTDSYMIAQTSAGGVFKAMSSLKSEVIQRANAFAETKGMVAIPIAAKESPAYPGHMPSFEYQFRLVEKTDARATGAGMMPRADMVIENKVIAAAPRNIADPGTSKPDLYTELVKLDDLRKKGIINESEFQAQKAKLLSR